MMSGQYDEEDTDDPHQAEQHIAPVPRISVQAFCETEQTLAAVTAAGQDRRLAKAHLTAKPGGLAAAVEVYGSMPTPNVIIIESDGTRDILEGLDDLAGVCDPGGFGMGPERYAALRRVHTAGGLPIRMRLFGSATMRLMPSSARQVSTLLQAKGDVKLDPHARPVAEGEAQTLGRRLVRVGDGDRPRSVTMPGIGQIAVHDDTRRLRRMLSRDRATILFATVTEHAGRWWVALTVQAADLHPARHHQPRDAADSTGWVGVDRGLAAFIVAATTDGVEVSRITDAPKALATGMPHQRRLAKSLSRKKKGSHNRRHAAVRLGRHHHRVVNRRKHFLHQVSNQLVKTHDRLVIEDLHTAGMLSNHRLARAISDAGWAQLARQLHYKQAWLGGQIAVADRWYPSSRVCSACGSRRTDLSLAERTFTCPNGHRLDRDLNAAINLAHWGQYHYRTPDPQAGGRATNARRQDGSDQHPARAGESSLDDAGTDVQTAPAA